MIEPLLMGYYMLKNIRKLSKKYTQVKGCFKIYYFNNSNKQNYKQNIMYNKLDIT